MPQSDFRLGLYFLALYLIYFTAQHYSYIFHLFIFKFTYIILPKVRNLRLKSIYNILIF